MTVACCSQFSIGGICDLINYYLEFRLVYISTMGWMDIAKENTDIMEGYQVSCFASRNKGS